MNGNFHGAVKAEDIGGDIKLVYLLSERVVLKVGFQCLIIAVDIHLLWVAVQYRVEDIVADESPIRV